MTNSKRGKQCSLKLGQFHPYLILFNLGSNLRNLTTLVVATQDSYSVFVADFESDEKGDGFHRVIPTIHVITHKQVIRVGTLPT